MSTRGRGRGRGQGISRGPPQIARMITELKGYGPEMQIKVWKRYENDDLNDAYSIRAAKYQPDQIEMRSDRNENRYVYGHRYRYCELGSFW